MFATGGKLVSQATQSPEPPLRGDTRCAQPPGMHGGTAPLRIVVVPE